MRALPRQGVVTLEDVARLAGVSRSTVSRVINGQPHVRAETKARVLAAVERLGYRPHPIARSLATRRTKVVSMLIPESLTKLFSDQFFAILLQGAVHACNTRGYQMVLALFDDPRRQEELYRQLLQNGYVEGAVVASAAPDDPVIQALREDGIPVVAVGKQPGLPYVDVNNYGGARMATEHLLSLGYRRIATITGPLSHLHVQDRLAGYRDALKAHGIPYEEELVVEGGFTEVGAMAAVAKLLPLRPEAIFVQSDTMAAGVMRALRSHGLRVPEDVAVVGFDDIPLASLLDPPLTTVRQPIRLLGFMAVELLVDLLDGHNPGPRENTVLPVELVVRSSCGITRKQFLEKRSEKPFPVKGET
ncbi:MAG: LacI family transcriptional regulator [Candidatus Bipolaricaulota bacterium]|nr:LacI family transcriptional regulator [Candidatus Bipolaricaulota bacterium]MDW8126464.1 LacI family DNA-binding transcriptional regulator [Candidatus Bipolaricaulota bacterium]